MARRRRHRRARDDQIGELVCDREPIEEAVDHAHPVAVRHPRELSLEDRAQRRRGLDRHHLVRPVDQLQRQPAGAGADLDDPLDAARQPREHLRMEALGADEPLVELRLETVEELPGERLIGSGIGVLARYEARRLVVGEDVEVRRGVAAPHLDTAPRARIRADHRRRPSSCPFPTAAASAASPRGAPAGSAPRTPPPGSPRSGSARRATERRCSGFDGRRPR